MEYLYWRIKVLKLTSLSRSTIGATRLICLFYMTCLLHFVRIKVQIRSCRFTIVPKTGVPESRIQVEILHQMHHVPYMLVPVQRLKVAFPHHSLMHHGTEYGVTLSQIERTIVLQVEL